MLTSLDRTARIAVAGVFLALIVDGMDLQMLALALPSLSADLRVSSVMAGALGTYTLLGMGIGGILAGFLSDRIGRTRVTWWAVFVFTVCTGTIAFCQTYWQVAVMRFVSGFGIAALYSIGTLLAAEYVPTNIRTTVLGALQGGWSIGYVAAALLSSAVIPKYGWRPLFLGPTLQAGRQCGRARDRRPTCPYFVRSGRTGRCARRSSCGRSRPSRCNSAITARTPGCPVIS
jgi:MFS transporter, AAHS family, cis,cis-muconate transporter